MIRKGFFLALVVVIVLGSLIAGDGMGAGSEEDGLQGVAAGSTPTPTPVHGRYWYEPESLPGPPEIDRTGQKSRPGPTPHQPTVWKSSSKS